jgi:hydrogenase maturation protease
MNALVVGLGHPDRGDDAVGLIAAREVMARREAEQGPATVRVLVAESGLVAVLEELAHTDRVVLLDAVRSGGTPGTIHRIDLNADALPRATTTSSHGMDVAAAIELARTLGWLPPLAVLLGVEIGEVGIGAPMHPDVRAAIPRLVERALRWATATWVQDLHLGA